VKVHRMRKFGQSSGTVALLALVVLLSAAYSHGEEPNALQFQIPVQALSSALNEFAQQSHQQILFAPDLVAQKRSMSVRGDMQPLAALKLLLNETGLTFKTTPNGAILIGNPNELHSAAAPTPSSRAPRGSELNDPDADITTITVEGARQRESVLRQVKHYVTAITPPSYQVSLGRWEKRTPLCPLVAGLSHDDGSDILARLSQITVSIGAPLAPPPCKPNFHVIVTSEPDELLKAWSKRDPWMFDDDADEGGAKIHQFLNASTPVRAWYNVSFSDLEGLPLHWQFRSGVLARQGDHAGGLRDLSSVILIVDARLTEGVSFGQLAAYLAMVGLAQIRLDSKLGDAPTILQVFSSRGKAPLQGLSSWDQAYLKALYHTDRSDKTQRLAIARSIAHEIVP
jgi:secretin/TonB-like protein